MSDDTRCLECDGNGEVFTGTEHGGYGHVVLCPACFGGELDPNEPEQVSTARRDSIDRAREAWAAREFGPSPQTAMSRMYRWVSLEHNRFFYGQDALAKARGDRDGAPF